MNCRSAILFFLLLAPMTRSAELTDLGHGLAYLRVHDLAETRKAAVSTIQDNRPLVLDLRHVTATDEDAGALSSAWKARPGKSRLYVLVGSGTAPAVAAALASLPAGVFTLGVAQSQPAPMIAVAQTPEADRRAYDALDSGAPLANLISGKIEKERYDEASLVKDFANGNRELRPPPPPDPTAPPAPATNATSKAPPPVDRVLQRAIHLHLVVQAIR
jgi:hypothetical protein